jgi:hypothetical protein
MPRLCSICTHEKTAAIAKALATGGSNRDVAARFRVSSSSVQRHRVGCLRSPRRSKAPTDPATSRSSSLGNGLPRFDKPRSLGNDDAQPDRCELCGIARGETSSEAIIRRVERLVWVAETLMAMAQKDGDVRLALQAIDRARLALELLMKGLGMVGSGGDKAMVNDNRSITTIYANASLEEIAAEKQRWAELRDRLMTRLSVPENENALPVTIDASENGTSIRDPKALTT